MAGQHPLPGYRDGRGFSIGHQAVDIPAPAGTPVRAMGDGVVAGAGDDGLTPYNLDFSESGGGKLVAIHSKLQTSGRMAVSASLPVILQSAHLSSVAVKPGDRVKAGQVIGAVGATGNATGDHLHQAVRVGGVWRPYYELLAMPGSLTGTGVDLGALANYGSGPVQQPPPHSRDAYPLDAGKSCAPGYNLGMIDPGILDTIVPGVWFGRPRGSSGTVVACVREGLAVGDNVRAEAAAEAIANAADTLGDVARNFGFFALFAVLLILGAWALVRR